MQIAALRNLKMSQSGGRKAQFLRALRRNSRNAKNASPNCSTRKPFARFRSDLKRASAELQLPAPTQLARSRDSLNSMRRKLPDSPPSDETLHHYRIVGKRARYIAELAGDTPEAPASSNNSSTCRIS